MPLYKLVYSVDGKEQSAPLFLHLANDNQVTNADELKFTVMIGRRAWTGRVDPSMERLQIAKRDVPTLPDGNERGFVERLFWLLEDMARSKCSCEIVKDAQESLDLVFNRKSPGITQVHKVLTMKGKRSSLEMLKPLCMALNQEVTQLRSQEAEFVNKAKELEKEYKVLKTQYKRNVVPLQKQVHENCLKASIYDLILKRRLDHVVLHELFEDDFEEYAFIEDYEPPPSMRVSPESNASRRSLTSRTQGSQKISSATSSRSSSSRWSTPEKTGKGRKRKATQKLSPIPSSPSEQEKGDDGTPISVAPSRKRRLRRKPSAISSSSDEEEEYESEEEFHERNNKRNSKARKKPVSKARKTLRLEKPEDDGEVQGTLENQAMAKTISLSQYKYPSQRSHTSTNRSQSSNAQPPATLTLSQHEYPSQGSQALESKLTQPPATLTPSQLETQATAKSSSKSQDPQTRPTVPAALDSSEDELEKEIRKPKPVTRHQSSLDDSDSDSGDHWLM